MPIPLRPRLHDGVVVRRHLTAETDWVVLHDHDSHRVLRALDVQWRVLALADGTRDVEGILVAARARGITISDEDLEALDPEARRAYDGVAPAILECALGAGLDEERADAVRRALRGRV